MTPVVDQRIGKIQRGTIAAVVADAGDDLVWGQFQPMVVPRDLRNLLGVGRHLRVPSALVLAFDLGIDPFQLRQLLDAGQNSLGDFFGDGVDELLGVHGVPPLKEVVSPKNEHLPKVQLAKKLESISVFLLCEIPFPFQNPLRILDAWPDAIQVGAGAVYARRRERKTGQVGRGTGEYGTGENGTWAIVAGGCGNGPRHNGSWPDFRCSPAAPGLSSDFRYCTIAVHRRQGRPVGSNGRNGLEIQHLEFWPTEREHNSALMFLRTLVP